MKKKKDALAYSARSEISHIEEARKLLDFTERADMLQTFDGVCFLEYVDTITVSTRSELVFKMKCGLELTERIE